MIGNVDGVRNGDGHLNFDGNRAIDVFLDDLLNGIRTIDDFLDGFLDDLLDMNGTVDDFLDRVRNAHLKGIRFVFL